MKRYPEYKPFGNYWISKIPTHWKEQKIKHLFDERVEKGYPDEPLLAATQNRGVILKSDYESRTVEATKDLHLLKFVKEGDFVISLRSFQGGIEYSYCQGIISPAYTIMIPRSEIDSSYFRHLAKSRTFIELLKGCVTGIREGQNINYALLRTYLLPLPPIEEQKIIADYLDKKIEQIDRFISLQKEAISLLKELRQAEITKAVTKGLDENAEMKDSGVEWIGEIPSKWEVCRLKNLAVGFSKGNGITKDDIVPNGDTPCVRYGEIYTKYNHSFCECLTRTNASLINPQKYFSYGDILFTCTGELVEEIGKSIVYLGDGNCLAGGDILVLHHLQCPVFLNYALNSNYAQEQKSYGKSKLKVVHISASDIGNLMIVLPPISEQEIIVLYLDKKCAEIDSAIQNKEALIEKVTEYKTRLISDAVTGKIDVRGEAI